MASVSLPRSLAWAALVAGGLAVAPPAGHAQPDCFKPVTNPTGEARQRVTEFRDGRPTNKEQLAKVRQDLEGFTAYLVNRVTDEKYYKTSQEFRPPIDAPSVETLMNEIERYTLKPVVGGKYTIDQSDYVIDFGKAFDKHVKAVLTTACTPVIHVNAARMLSIAARSGAPAFGPTILELLTNPGTPPAVRYYAIKAAEGLIGAADIRSMETRRHTLMANPEDERLLVALVKRLEAMVNGSARSRRGSSSCRSRPRPGRSCGGRRCGRSASCGSPPSAGTRASSPPPRRSRSPRWPSTTRRSTRRRPRRRWPRR